MAAKTTKTTVSPGHKAWDQARGVEPRRDPKTIDHNFVADPRGGPSFKLRTASRSRAIRNGRTKAKASKPRAFHRPQAKEQYNGPEYLSGSGGAGGVKDGHAVRRARWTAEPDTPRSAGLQARQRQNRTLRVRPRSRSARTTSPGICGQAGSGPFTTATRARASADSNPRQPRPK